MKARDLFGVALRVLGIWFLYQAGYYAVFLFLKLGDATLNNIPIAQDKIFIGYYLVIAFLLLAAADKIVGLIYGPAVERQPTP